MLTFPVSLEMLVWLNHAAWRKAQGELRPTRMPVPVEDLAVIAEVWGLPYWRVWQAWLAVRAARAAQHRGPLRMFEWAPLKRALGHRPGDLRDASYGSSGCAMVHDGLSFGALAGRVGVARGNVLRAEHVGWLTLPQADRWCDHAGVSPVEVWGRWYEAVCAVMAPVSMAEVRVELLVAS